MHNTSGTALAVLGPMPRPAFPDIDMDGQRCAQKGCFDVGTLTTKLLPDGTLNMIGMLCFEHVKEHILWTGSFVTSDAYVYVGRVYDLSWPIEHNPVRLIYTCPRADIDVIMRSIVMWQGSDYSLTMGVVEFVNKMLSTDTDK